MTKKVFDLHVHAKRRYMQRLGSFSIADSTLKEMEQDIAYKKCIFLEKNTNRIATVAVFNKDTKNVVAVAYDKKRKGIVTFLPNDVLAKFIDEIKDKCGRFTHGDKYEYYKNIEKDKEISKKKALEKKNMKCIICGCKGEDVKEVKVRFAREHLNTFRPDPWCASCIEKRSEELKIAKTNKYFFKR